MYRNGKFRKIPEILKKTGIFPTRHFVHYKLENVNFLTYNDSKNNNNSIVVVFAVINIVISKNNNNSTAVNLNFFYLILYKQFSFKFHSFIENRSSKIDNLPITDYQFFYFYRKFRKVTY